MKKLVFAIALTCLGTFSGAQAPQPENVLGPPPGNFTISYSIIFVNWDKYVGECQIQAVSEQRLYYLYAKQALWVKNCSHLPELHSTVWGSAMEHHRGNGDQIRLVYSTESGKVSTVSYFLSRTTQYREK